jgi:NAD(P)-dependent dehydrogenase (short-subunit alcohol dehydrogenase family)
MAKLLDIDACIQRTMNMFGRIDILVDCAKILIIKPILDHTEQDFDRVSDAKCSVR